MLWSLQRLGQCAQVVEADSCIVDAQSKAAALLYYRYPKLYPELSRYATMMHGIRHLNLKLSTWDAMHFFKVSVGGFDQLRETGHTTYDIFNRLPNLKRVKILLPDDQRDRRYQFTVKLFHPVSRCHRTLHRYIYEAIAQMQAVSDFKVEVKRFMDSNERIRFEEMQSKAELSRKTTSQDLADLYADSTGGVRLDSPGGSLASGNSDPLEHGVTREAVQSVDELFPPLCKCTPSCSEIMSSRDRIRRYDDE
ncbi:hypothetical protein BU24DRAFT_339387 [Aaosphaeria arxii CBS 175.79]|uniref:Uncharacterized protein n=1 Tax=Aaosphaeria arxii CBS 175.79 TaxID=1450172 RepID=A0A6A5Y8X5_9PLEO|nr:uncharacterized protein BU24DRAFT_339387 [Aaosphaeria arxii CBS 175.79]KAF2021789.1 hypothetical protein BU24DRAFT_339387 [Aaosphaeria arxii CBS 175.79]